MKGQTWTSNISYVEREGGKETADNQLSREVIFGDVLWVKLSGSSWWPAQVVDENTVSVCNKPTKKSRGEVLVRLYGSYKYMYVNSNECHLEFDNVLMENNGNYSEILKKSLDQDLSCIKSGRSKGQGSKSKGIVRTEVSQDELSKHNGLYTNQENEPVTSASVSPKVSDANSRPTKAKNGNVLSERPKKTRFSPRSLSAANIPQTVGKNGNSLPEKSPEAKTKKQKLDGVHKKVEPKRPDPVTPGRRSEELSARRMKVMQSLGLTAPCGSPFN